MSPLPNKVSEIARLREQIAREHEAAAWACTGLAEGTAKHWFISRRMERIGVHQQHLSALIGEQASLAVVLAVMEESPPQRAAEAKKSAELDVPSNALFGKGTMIESKEKR